MKKILLATLLASSGLCSQRAYSVPAHSGKTVITLADGTQVKAQMMGDEFFHYYRTEEGQLFRRAENGAFRRMETAELKALQESASEQREQTHARRTRKRVGEFVEGGIKGQKKGVVILVSFKDNDFVTANPNQIFNDFFNKKDYSSNSMSGSVADYFEAQSYGQLTVDFDVVGPYKLSKNMNYYGGNNTNGSDSNPMAMAEEACRMANADVNFADYDWNSDGVVDQVFFIYAGYGENYGGADPNTIWPHAYYFPDGIELDYMKFHNYACTSELMGISGSTLTGIGTACHEFSHCLGLPDTYDTNGSGGVGMADWDIMCGGSYNNSSRTPAGYTSYQRWVSGWLTPVEVTAEMDVKNMKPLEDAPEAYILYNDANRNEYYLLENRQQKGFDMALPGHGLLVTHIDYDKNAWTQNGPNNVPTHQRITVIPADGELTASGDNGDPFPGKQGVRNLTDWSTPSAAKVYNANTDGTKFMHKAIESITESEDGLVSFSLMKPELAAPVMRSAYEGNTLTISWDAVAGADTYDLQYTYIPAQGGIEDARLFEEDFQGAYKASAGFSDIGASLNKYLSTPGFSGENLFQTPDLLRLGSSKNKGILYTPLISQLSTGKFTVAFTLKPFADGQETNVTLSAYTPEGVQESFSLNFSEQKTFVIQSEQIYKGRVRLELVAEQRCYISYMAMYDGLFDLEKSNARAITRAGVQDVSVQVKGTSYTIENADPSGTYQVTMRSLSGYRIGRWSEMFEVAPSETSILLPQDKPSALDSWFDLNGRRISEPTRPGVYIYNGKKVMK